MQDKFKNNPLFTTDIGEIPDSVRMFVEIPKGSINKYEYDVETGRIVLDRVVYEMLPYPVEYGLIPQTWDEDEDMLDVMSLINYPTFPGCELDVRMIGVMEFVDDGEVDDKLLAVPKEDVRFEHIKSINDLPEHTIDEIGFFFKRYKDLQFKYRNKPQSELVIKGFGDKDRAVEILEDAMKRFEDKFTK
jgi:inorganic pyrophosphatase